MSRLVSSSLKSLVLAAALALPALANTTLTAPVTMDATSELVVSVVNPGVASVTYSVVFYDAITGQTLATKQGTLAGLRGAAVLLEVPGARDAVVAIISTSGQRKHLASLTVRDRVTKVPRGFIGGAGGDGTGI